MIWTELRILQDRRQWWKLPRILKNSACARKISADALLRGREKPVGEAGTHTLALEGRVAIVTGGARGIGAAISEKMVAEGAKVIVADSGVDIAGNDPDPSVAEAFAGRLGESAVAYTDDMGVQAAAVQAVEKAVETFGGIDIVVNNAAILRDAFVFKGSADDWDAAIRNNLSGLHYRQRRHQSDAGSGPRRP